ncbi:hypothetical protein [Sporosarcina sp. D27]|uniref:hypothetical protein n=1 Tax=Sporosarcina sp. D27 TaxID=1382305 RepID=UPI000472E3B4|nr:hypothetical protein [Sporosarcina sp. D27]
MRALVNCKSNEVTESEFTEEEKTIMQQENAERDFLESITPGADEADKAKTELIVVDLLIELGVL